MSITRTLLFSGLLLFSLNVGAQQLPYHYGIDANAFAWNPALAGRFNFRSAGGSYNQPWSEFEDAPLNIQVFAESPIKPLRMSAGLAVGRELSNTYDRTDVTAAMNYKLRFGHRGKRQIAIGISFRWEQLQLSIDNPIVNDPGDPLIGSARQVYSRMNAGAGLFFASDDDYYDETIYFAGLAVYPAIPGGLGNDLQRYRPEVHGSFMAGGSFKMQGDWFLEPVLWVDYSVPQQFYPQFYLKLERDRYYWARLHITSNSAGIGIGYMINFGQFLDFRIGITSRAWFGSIGAVNRPGLDGELILREQLPGRDVSF
ncbi:MAG: type IX secretion system membrane protein PorP/SprF [bacterium]|nr:type IX secretion system membrane protein PorP/SprF [bacterium]